MLLLQKNIVLFTKIYCIIRVEAWHKSMKDSEREGELGKAITELETKLVELEKKY